MMNTINFMKTSMSLAIASLVIASTSPVHAVEIQKKNNADNLNLDSSWISGIAPDAAGSDTVKFEGFNTINELGGNIHWKGIKKNNNKFHTFNDSGNTFTLTLGSGGTSGGASGNFIFDAAVVLSADQAWNAKGSHTIQKTLDNAGFTLTATTLDVTSNGVLSGSGNLIITGTSTLSGTNTYTGSTTVQDSGILY